MEDIRGKIESIRYYNEDNYFTIAEASYESNSRNIFILKGKSPIIRKNLLFTATGEWVMDKKYGKQFVFNEFSERIPTTSDGIKAYLSCGMIKGIGPSLAKAIVDKFGDKSLDVIDYEPERLKEISGIGAKKLQSIIEQMTEQKNIREIMVFLKTYGISDNFAAKIYKCYGNKTIEILKDNPYKMAEDIEGIGFKKADEIALKIGFEPTGEKRICMGISYILKEAASDKDTFLFKNELVKKTSSIDFLNVDASFVMKFMDLMIENGKLIMDGEKIYLPKYYTIEQHVAYMIASRINTSMTDDILLFQNFDTNGVEYSDEQLKAIESAVKSKMTVITGGPGTGKTTILKGIISIFKKYSMIIKLAAPTGRAAKRMSESTGLEAVTIHRLLEWQQGEFTRNESNPLYGDVLIVDECSMINLSLMNSLINAIPANMKFIMVGDVDQLPPIGCGNVLKDIIDSNTVPVCRLTKIYRQDADSKIILNAHAINNSQMPDISNAKNTDFFFFRVNGTDKIKEQIVRLVTDAIPNKFGIPSSDIQVLSPMRKSSDIIGSTQLNLALQDAINPNGNSLSNGIYKIRIGDKVMQTSNDYDLGVFNGDIGVVDNIDFENNTVSVNFYGYDDIITYDKSNIDELELAYATTVHKSQGSEYPVVIIVADKSQYIMLQKQLFYTAVTRAKKICIVIGSEDAIRIMVSTKAKDNRNSFLKERILQFYDKLIFANS